MVRDTAAGQRVDFHRMTRMPIMLVSGLRENCLNTPVNVPEIKNDGLRPQVRSTTLRGHPG